MVSIEVPVTTPAANDVAEQLENRLGDPFDPKSPASFEHVLRTDDARTAADGLMGALADWEFPEHLVPAAHGGRLHDVEELLLLCRCISRRDMRAALAYGTTFLGALPVWLWGSVPQRELVADKIRRGGLGSFGLSEREHGSDIGNYDVVARRIGAGTELSGTKWPIGNATRGSFATIHSRDGDSRTYSLILVDKDALDSRTWSNEPPADTLGLRGHDLSGIAFDNCPVGDDVTIGTPGSGTSKALKTLQITRVLTASMSLGSLDTALRTTLAHCRERRLYGDTVDRIPVVRSDIVTAYLDLLVAEAVALSASRAVSVAPDRVSMWSSVAKYFVTTTVDTAIARLARVFSARGYIREDVRASVFQKVWRDHLAAAIFEGTSHVNLGNVAAQLPAVTAARAVSPGSEPDGLLGALFGDRPSRPVWEPDGRAMSMTNNGADEIWAAWPALSGTYGVAGDAVRRLDVIRRSNRARVEALPLTSGTAGSSVASHHAADVHCLLHAASCVLAVQAAGGTTDRPWWVPLALQRILQRLDPMARLDEDLMEQAMAALTAQADGNRMFMLTDVRLGSG